MPRPDEMDDEAWRREHGGRPRPRPDVADGEGRFPTEPDPLPTVPPDRDPKPPVKEPPDAPGQPPPGPDPQPEGDPVPKDPPDRRLHEDGRGV